MMYTLFDGTGHVSLKPLTYTRPVAEIRVGIFSVREKWEKYLGDECKVRTKDYLTEKYNGNDMAGSLGIAATVLPNSKLVHAIKKLEINQLLIKDGTVIAINELPEANADFDSYLDGFEMLEYDDDISFLINPCDIFSLNGKELEADFNLLDIHDSKKNLAIGQNNQVIGDDVFVEEGAIVNACILNSSTGPIYIESGAEIMEGTIIRGPFAALKGSVCKVGTKVYGPTTLGPCSKIGGEVNNCVFQGYSNKGHDGFLGNSVIGEWCNLGADTNSSNLKNNYSNIRVWSYSAEGNIDTNLQFHGLIMGDHSKCGINTMFNTGTIVGVGANLFGGNFLPKFIPSFSWGGSEITETYQFDKAMSVASVVMQRRNLTLTDADKNILSQVFTDSKKYRSWE
ncbi:MAG: glucose-1-phosphate thymidylyltransferase [Crocinitomicaceae bacterium]|nr:glucose-1-phosphate thymidylyltransferase [Crocinitomicaceae bacterium]MBT6514925.1 glucose-1-phosphate thymidylyltransferase [Crocinitomicaceae bacterium]